jgi:hypothetical protein
VDENREMKRRKDRKGMKQLFLPIHIAPEGPKRTGVELG